MANSSSGSQDIARQTLVDRLLDSVKQCQIRFGGKTELATDGDSRVSCLCAQWETILQFGLKSSRKLNPLRHVAGQVLLRPEGESAWWQFLKEHLSPTEIRRFNSLDNITTDAGRARAWLRSALNEQSLEKYLHSFLGNKRLLSSYYEQEALLLDEERSAMLPMMAAGLSSILFAINIDNSEFNISKQNPSTAGLNIRLAPGPVWQPPSPTYTAVQSQSQGKEKKKRKKKKANIAIASIENADFEENYDTEQIKVGGNGEERRQGGLIDNSSEHTSLFPAFKNSSNQEDSDAVVEQKTGEKAQAQFPLGESDSSQRESDGSRSGITSDNLPKTVDNLTKQKTPRGKHLNLRLEDEQRNQVPFKDSLVDHTDETTDTEPLVDLNSGVSLTPVARPDEAKVWAIQNDSESPGTESTRSSPMTLELLKPRRDSPVSSGFTTDDDVSEDASLAIDATEVALLAAQDVHREMADFTRNSLVRTMGDGSTSPPNGSETSKEMTSGELKQAIVSMMLRKDEVEECNRSLRQLLDKEMLESSALRLQVEDLKKERSLSKEAHQATMQALSSENDLLKHQLKKYVAAVQSLRRNEPVNIAVPGVREDDDLPVLPDRGKVTDNESEDAEIGFERKLIQVADMHGELIELNERLQKMLNVREHQLRRLREELINLRGPLPEDIHHDDSLSLDEFGPRLVPVNTRPLINIWIPSAFAQGKSSNVHHTYQVYVRIKDDEWNVYRRYSHFHDMHKQMSKQYPGVGNFRFPPKKVIGNRDAKFVEMRRRHLQSYLRKLINYSLRIIPELSENPSKSILVKSFPFFGSSPKDDALPVPENDVQAHYTGL